VLLGHSEKTWTTEKSVVQTSGKVETHKGLPPNQPNLRISACKLYQLQWSQLKAPRPPSSNPRQRLQLPLADKVEGNGCYSSATVVNPNKVTTEITCDSGVMLKTENWTAKKLTGICLTLPTTNLVTV